MATIQILLLILFLIFYVLTRDVWIIIKKNDKLQYEIHFPIFAIDLRSNDKRRNNDRSNGSKLSPLAYLRIVSAVANRLSGTEIIVSRLEIPFSDDKSEGSRFALPITKQYAIYFLLAYLRGKTKRLVLNDNTFILSPDAANTQFHLTAKQKLFNFILVIFSFLLCLYKEKKHARMVKNVGE